MTKAELERRIEHLERELRSVQQILNNHTCDGPRPIFMHPYIPPADGTARQPHQWPMPWNICGAVT